MMYCSLLPGAAVGVFGLSAFWIARLSGGGEAMPIGTTLLAIGRFPLLLRRATLVSVEPPVALAGACAWKLNVIGLPGASVATFHVTAPPRNCPPGDASMNVIPPVSVSLI